MANYPPGTSQDEVDLENQQGNMSDEDMLEQVRQGMGGDEPPPQGGMMWKNLGDDTVALENDPSDENIAAFEAYWGRENLPESVLGDVYGGSFDETKAYSPDFQRQRTRGPR